MSLTLSFGLDQIVDFAEVPWIDQADLELDKELRS